MLCPHGIDQRVCATCAADQRPHHEARPSPTETFADNMAECAYDPSHFVHPGERVRHLDGLGWSCMRCASHPATGPDPRTRRGATTASRPPRSRAETAGLASIIAAGLLVIGFVAVSWLNASADAKFDEVGQAIEADSPGPAAAPEPEAPLSPEATLRGSLQDEFDGTAEVTIENGIIHISWEVGMGLTEGLTKDSLRFDATNAIRAADESEVPYEVIQLTGRAVMVDKLGQESLDDVLDGRWDRATVQQINWASFNFKDITEIVPGVYLHSAFHY